MNESIRLLEKMYEDCESDEWYGRLLSNNDQTIYVECGRQMIMYIRTSYEPKREPLFQVTIRDIHLDESFQKQGIFTRFVEYLLSLPRIQAVQLESVQPDWLKKRLSESTLWICQTEYEEFCPIYARINNEKPFSLF